MAGITIGGVEPDAVFDISTNARTEDLGDATITAGDTATNRSFESGDLVVIDREGGETWRGFLTGMPTSESDGTLALEAKDTRYELKERGLERMFYDMDSGEAVREAVEHTAEPAGATAVHTGSSTGGWSSDFPIFELGRLGAEKIHDRGDDIVFCGLRAGASGTYRATYRGVPAAAIPGSGQVTSLETSVFVNDPGGQIETEVELRDDSGAQYVWDMGAGGGGGFDVRELRAEQAEPDGELGADGALQYRFTVKGDLSDDTGIAIDWAETTSFTLEPRDTGLTTDNVEDTGQDITRRVDKNVLEFMRDVQKEAGYSSWIDENDDLHFKPSGGDRFDGDIVKGETPVTDAQFKTDFKQIDNKVRVQGAEGAGATARLSDPASIDYYGVSPRTEPIVDPELQSAREAEDRGRGHLEDNAWGDTVAVFEVADREYQRLEKGEAVYVEWPPRDIEGVYVVTETNTDKAGAVRVSLGVRV